MKITDILKMLCIGLLTTITLTSCPSGSGDSEPGGGTDPVIPSGKTYNQSETISAEGEDKDITLNQLNAKIISIEYSCNWLSVVSNYYTSGAPSVHLNVRKNTEATSRTCNVTITTLGNNDKLLLQITQDAIKNGIDDVHNEKTDSTAYSKHAH